MIKFIFIIIFNFIIFSLNGQKPFGQGDGGVVELPVGSVYANSTDNTNPATLLGYGTWVAWGAGRMPIYYDSGDTDFDGAEETGGAKTHTLTEAEMPAHTHTTATLNGAGATGPTPPNDIRSTVSQTSGSAGSGNAHSILNPYITVYLWKRTV